MENNKTSEKSTSTSKTNTTSVSQEEKDKRNQDTYNARMGDSINYEEIDEDDDVALDEAASIDKDIDSGKEM